MRTQKDTKVLVIELNEVPWKVIKTFVERHPKSAFASVMPKAGRLRTHLPDTGQLHPKTSWQTFHRGVPDFTHGIREYNQLHSAGQENNPTFWALARKAGKRVGVGASIGSWPLPVDKDNIDFWFADPFAPDPESIPKSVTAFQEFNTLAVARSSRQVRTGGVSRKVIVNFLLNVPKLGIRASTVAFTIKQLIDERFNPAKAVRRRNIQALMSFDVAEKQWRHSQPHLTSIFVNHVAAAMHRYWAAAYPDDYESNNMPMEWRETYEHEIDAAMKVADTMLGRVLKTITESNTTLLIVGSMGQQAIAHEPTHNQLIIKDIKAFLALAGMRSEDYEKRPGMEPEYVLSFNSPALLDQFETACTRININGRAPEVKRASGTECALLVDQYNIDFDSVQVDKRTVPLESAGLHIEKIQDLAGSTAQHITEGLALVVSPTTDLSYLNEHSELVDLCSVTAAILKSIEAPVPHYMPEPFHDLVLALQSLQPPKNSKPSVPKSSGELRKGQESQTDQKSRIPSEVH